MSRTDKTRPHWVKVNDHGVEFHDHSRLGEKVYRSRPVKDENGDFVTEIVPRYVYADEYLRYREEQRQMRLRHWREWEHVSSPRSRDEDGFTIYYVRDGDYVSTRAEGKVMQDAQRAVADGHPRTLIETGTYRRRVMERYLAYTIPDHCTIDEKPRMVGRWSNANPCYMEANWGADINIYRCNCSMCRGSDPSYERARRRNNRDQMRKVIKLANSGEEDWEDGWNDLKVTTPTRYNTEWC